MQYQLQPKGGNSDYQIQQICKILKNYSETFVRTFGSIKNVFFYDSILVLTLNKDRDQTVM